VRQAAQLASKQQSLRPGERRAVAQQLHSLLVALDIHPVGAAGDDLFSNTEDADVDLFAND